MGPHQLQIFSSLAVLVAAAIIALFCDFLMHNNERLRADEGGSQPAAIDLTAPKQRSVTGNESKRAISPEALAAINRGIARAAAPPICESRPVRPPASKPIAARKDWASLLARTAHVKLPVGFQDKHTLRKLIESRLPVNGLVVSVSVSAPRGALPESVIRLLKSMMGPDDFAAARGDREFVLIYPRQSGDSAQRRLHLIAQQLWDIQLASMGSLQILFNWGATEACGEPIERAIAKAVESMEENRRGRQLATTAHAV
jgi:hypothetical protein